MEEAELLVFAEWNEAEELYRVELGWKLPELMMILAL